jgi:hypothetical protein
MCQDAPAPPLPADTRGPAIKSGTCLTLLCTMLLQHHHSVEHMAGARMTVTVACNVRTVAHISTPGHSVSTKTSDLMNGDERPPISMDVCTYLTGRVI